MLARGLSLVIRKYKNTSCLDLKNYKCKFKWCYLYLCVCVCMYVCMYCCMTTSMYCLYVGVDYTYIDINALAQRTFKFGFKPLLELDPMVPIRPQLLVSHANHLTTYV